MKDEDVRLIIGSPINVGECIGRGGESEIFSLENHKDFLYKRYTKPRPETLAKVQLLIRERFYELEGVMAPLSVMEQDGACIGFVMPAYHRAFEMEEVVFSPRTFLETFPTWTRIELIELAISYLSIVDSLHKKGALLGDVNPHNILFRNYDDVAIVDIDSVQIQEYLCPVGMEEYASPRLQGVKFSDVKRSLDDELFAVAVLLFKIFTLGKHPYASIGVENLSEAIKNNQFVYPIGDEDNSLVPKGNWEYVWYELPFEIQRNFKVIFQYGQRISIEKWIEALRIYQTNIRLGLCSRDIRPQGFGQFGDGVTININRRDITDKEVDLRTSLTLLSVSSQKRIGILELSTKAVKLLVAADSDEVIKSKPFDHKNFIREAFKTETGRGLNKDNVMDMDYFSSKVAPSIRRCIDKARHLEVTHLYTSATVAYRGAVNRKEIADYLKTQLGLSLCILKKEEEALSTIFAYQQSTRYKSELFASPWVLMIDQGGGSTEVSLFGQANRDIAQAYSINLGTTVLRNLLVRENREGALLSGALAKSDQLIRERLRVLDENIVALKSGLLGAVYCIAVGTAITKATRKKSNKEQHEYLFTVDTLEKVVEQSEQKLLRQFKYIGEVLAASNLGEGNRCNESDVDTLLTIRLGIPMFVGIMKKYGVDHLRVSGTGLWYGQYYSKLYNID